MPIPLWGAMAYGGKLLQLDDPSVGADSVDEDAETENPYTATLVTSPFSAGPGTYSDLRRFTLNVETPATVQVLVQGMRDKQLSGTVITRNITPVEARDTDFPQKITGTEFQESITLQGWPTSVAPNTSLGVASVMMVVRRSERGGNDT